jgi:Spy/CpxP family protein refolding chaperone
MKRNIKTLAIIFSVVLNIVFTGAYLYHRSDTDLSIDHHFTNRRHLLYEELNLSQEQLDKIEPIRDRFHAFLDQQGHAIQDNRLELVDLLARENPDRKEIDDKQKKIRALQGQMQEKVIDHLLEGSRIFTTEQRAKFFALLKGRIETNEEGFPRRSGLRRVLGNDESTRRRENEPK